MGLPLAILAIYSRKTEAARRFAGIIPRFHRKVSDGDNVSDMIVVSVAGGFTGESPVG
jgi:hypothetical protein